MDWLTWTARVIEATIWPIVTCVTVLLFRKPVVQVLRSLRHAKYGELEVGFGEKLAELERVAEAAELPDAESSGLATFRNADGLLDHVGQLAAISPAAAVFELWRAIEAELRAACEKVGLDAGPNGRSAIKALRQGGFLSDDAAGLAAGLRDLRNDATHNAIQFTPAGAIELAKVGARLLALVEMIPVDRNKERPTIGGRADAPGIQGPRRLG